MVTTGGTSTDDTLEDVEELAQKHDISKSEALELLLVTELRKVNDKLNDIEVHTNNTVRKL